MDRLILLVIIFSFIKSSSCSNIEILYKPESIIFQNTTNSLSSSDLSKFLSQCLGYTTKKPDWNGFHGYKNIAKNIPHNIIIFHIPISLQPIATHTFPFQIDSDLSKQYLKTKNAMISKHNNVLADFILFNKNKKDRITMESQIDALEKHLKMIEPQSQDHAALLWFDMFVNKNNLNVDQENIERRFQKILNHLKYLFGNDLLILSIYDENQMFLERVTRQLKNTRDPSTATKFNLAHDYDVDFHSSFVTIGFATLLFVLAVFVISVSMWNIDPGRDSIIYRLTSQKIKKDQ